MRAWVGAPFAVMRTASPTLPECPENPPPRPAALAAADGSATIVASIYAREHIVSAVSVDGLNFEMEPGVRIGQETERETYAVYAP